MKKFLKEFEEFALRGNVMDLAVGVIIGGAFKGIVDSLVNDILSPLLGLFLYADFNALSFSIGSATIKYGQFITNVISFIIMAFIIFLMVKGMNKLSGLGGKKKEEPKPRKCPYCQSEIDKKATRCPFCTSKLDTEKTPA